MARVFLDTNILFDIGYKKPEFYASLGKHDVYISPLSFHILGYAYKIKIPDDRLSFLAKEFVFVDFTQKILKEALESPTKDLEDNIQLHSAKAGKCDYFLTSDNNLLKLKYFKKVKIAEKI